MRASGDLIVRVVRTGPTEASVLGVAITLDDVVEVLVNGAVVATGRPVWNLDYWFHEVRVSDGATVQTRIGSATSLPVSVPPYLAQPVGPAGFVYAKGSGLMLNGAPIQLFGIDEQTSFVYAMIASGLYGASNPNDYWGNNQLFPSGPGTKIPGVSTPDELWREFFRYFLHYESASSEPYHPRPNLLRIWIVDHNFGIEGAYNAWKSNPAKFWEIFDRLVYWADRAGVYLVPVLGHIDGGRDNRFYDTASPSYARHIELVRAILTRYNDQPRIAMWDIWNEADVNNDAYWASVGGIVGFKAWASRYIAHVKPYSSNHLLTLGSGGWTLFPGVPSFGWQYHFFFNDIPGLGVSHHHAYATAEDQYLIDWQGEWHKGLGIPHFVGEYGYNLWPGPSAYGYGYWPWYTERTRAAGWPAIASMVWWDNGRGPYTDYPYLGSLPDYPPSSSFDFSLSLSPMSGIALQGQSATTTVTTTLTAGTTQSVAFSASGLPPGGSASFSPASCSPTCSSTVTLSTSSTTPSGTYPITVAATGGGVAKSAPYSLTVSSPCPSSPPTYPSTTWDRVWCDSGSSTKLADTPDEGLEKFDNSWGAGTVAGIRADDIGFRSGRTISFPAAADYIFVVGGDDGIRVWIDGALVLDKWFQQPYTTYLFTRSLSAGDHPVRLDYYEGGGEARVSFSFSQVIPTDVTPPVRVTDLNAASSGKESVTLRWTAPGDDGTSGTASEYDIRYSSAGPMNESNFPLATPVATSTPRAAGTSEIVNVTGLTPGTQYWFGLRAADEVPNWSPVSNIPSAATSPAVTIDTTPPATVTDLRTIRTSENSVTLEWTAPGDDGMSGQATWYDFRYSTVGPITDSNFYDAVYYTLPFFPKPAALLEAVTVGGLQPSTTYWFSIRASDEIPNWSLPSNSPSAATLSSVPIDTTRPATVTDLRVVSVLGNSLVLRWTAPGDDGMSGQATWYDFRYSTVGPITDSNFYDALYYELPFFPNAPGATEEVSVSGLRPGTTYWFALKASDEVPNWSPASNAVGASTVSSGAIGILSTLPFLGLIVGISLATVALVVGSRRLDGEERAFGTITRTRRGGRSTLSGTDSEARAR